MQKRTEKTDQDVLAPVRRFFEQQKELGFDRIHVERSETQGESPEKKLNELWESIKDCQGCRLSQGRTQVVFGDGNPHAEVVIVGEAPGYDEDVQGIPFVGKAGQLLTKMLENGMGIPRPKVYICNVCKCRPPENRQPEPDEMGACEPYLQQQLAMIQPRVIIAMGNCAVKALLRSTTGITQLRGRFAEYEGIPVMPTFHPAYLLRNSNAKAEVWQDLQKVMELLGLPIPGKN